MLNYEYTKTTHPDWRHKAWVKVGEGSWQESSLQNQYALYEMELGEIQAVALFRRWLWVELQDRYNVVGREARELANAHLSQKEVQVKVPQGSLHGEVIVNALLWLSKHIEPPPTPVKGIDRRSPLHEPILEEGGITTRAKIDKKHIVWVTGNTQSRLGIITGWNEVYVHGYGVLPLDKFKHVQWIGNRLASSPLLQEKLNDALDALFLEDIRYAPLEYDPAPPGNIDRYESEWIDGDEYDLNQGMALQAADGDANGVDLLGYYAETGDVEAAVDLAAELTSYEGLEEERFYKRPPIASNVSETVIRNVYIYKGEQAPLLTKTPITQIVGGAARPVKKDEVQEYIKTFRKKKK